MKENLFVYYYFLGRRYGHSPKVAATWSREFCEWWDADPKIRGYAPRLDIKLFPRISG